MLERPNIPEQLIGERVRIEYGFSVTEVTFLPLGYDVHTAVYRVDTQEDAYFLKLRLSEFREFMVAIPHYLHQAGLQAVIDPVKTQSNKLSAHLGQAEIIVYPFIPGKNGYEAVMNEQQWAELGRTLNTMHQLVLPDVLREMIPSERFDPAWRALIQQFMAETIQRDYTDVVAQKLVHYMNKKRGEIMEMVQRADGLADRLKNQALEYVLCHADCHPGNYHIGEDGRFYLVDWDNPILAPKERDLMFFGAGMTGERANGQDEEWFYQGYGNAEVNVEAMVYYRYERIIQDMAEFCKQLLLTDEGGEDREQAYEFFTSNFAPGREVDSAKCLEAKLKS